jgi:hypothetical protein
MNWTNVIPIFASALFAMVVGILLELYKGHREKIKAQHDTHEKETRQITAAIVAMAYDIESLLHIVGQNVLPHYEASHAAYAELDNVSVDGARMGAFAQSLTNYPALFMTCPGPHFKELDFSNNLGFLNEKDPTLVKYSGWLTGFSREIEKAIRVRNENIETANKLLMESGGALNFLQLRIILQLQTASADTECVISWQLFDSLLRMERALEKVRKSYGAKDMNIVLPPALDPTMKRLREIMDKVPFHSLEPKA